MRASLHFTAITAALLGIAACGNGDDSLAPVPVQAAGKDASLASDATAQGADATEEPGAGRDAAVPVRALVRFANWAAGAPAVDFCLAPRGTGAFGRPIIAAEAEAVDEGGVIEAGPGALAFPGSTAYFLVDPGQYDVRLVTAGSFDCSAPITGDATNVALASGGLQTVALIGSPAATGTATALKIVGFVDETMGPLQGALLFRVINAATSVPDVDVGTVSSTLVFSAILFGVVYGTSSAGNPMADPNGYANVSGMGLQTVAARRIGDSGVAIVATAPNISLLAGSSLTFVAVDDPNQAGGARLVECLDGAGVAGIQGACHDVSSP
jgi:hypothetical protein